MGQLAEVTGAQGARWASSERKTATASNEGASGFWVAAGCPSSGRSVGLFERR